MNRLDHDGEPAPIGVQIAGADPVALAAAARHAVEHGAEIVDINMGCPAKKVCNAWAGSALLKDEALVGRIVSAVVGAVDVPVTLKIRTGWDHANRNGVRVARIAEDAGVRALAVHGRTRDMLYTGEAEYETIAAIKQAVRIPVIANGDVTSPQKARDVLAATGADALMIGRAAQGRPWIFREIAHFLATGELDAAARDRPSCATRCSSTCARYTRSMARSRVSASRASTWRGMRRIAPRTRRFAPSSIEPRRPRSSCA